MLTGRQGEGTEVAVQALWTDGGIPRNDEIQVRRTISTDQHSPGSRNKAKPPAVRMYKYDLCPLIGPSMKSSRLV